MSVGNKVALADMGAIPANFTVRASVPQLAVLQQAAAFVTHGGMNSVQEALFWGVPLVVVPQAADQMFVAQQVPALGAGVRLLNKDVTAARLRHAVQTVVQAPQYREASARVGASFRAAGGAKRAAEEIMAFKQRYNIT